MNEPVRIEIDVETLAVDGMTGEEAAALVAATERALNARLGAGTGDGAGATHPLAGTLADRLAAVIRDGRRRAG
jgi:hypothetical protein